MSLTEDITTLIDLVMSEFGWEFFTESATFNLNADLMFTSSSIKSNSAQ